MQQKNSLEAILREIEDSESLCINIQNRPMHKEKHLTQKKSEDEKTGKVSLPNRELRNKLCKYNRSASISTDSPAYGRNWCEKSVTREEKQREEEEFRVRRHNAAAFIQRINAERDERRRKDKEKIKQATEKARKESEELTRKLREQEEERLKRRKEESMQVYEQLRRKRELDHKRMEDIKYKANLSFKEEYLYKVLEDKYNNEVLTPVLEEKKKVLAMKRNQYKPISKEELIEHVKKYELLMAQKEESRKRELRARRQKEASSQKLIEKCKTSTLERQNKENLKRREEDEKKRHKAKELKEKMRNYSEIVKDTLHVRPSSTKARELQGLIAELKHPVRQHRDTRKLYDLAVINKRSNCSFDCADKGSRNDFPKINDTNIANVSNKEKGTGSTSKQRARDFSQEFPRESKPLRVDYLSEMRRRRAQKWEGTRPARYNWKDDLQNAQLNEVQRCRRVMDRAGRVEEQALMRERAMQGKGGVEKSVEVGECVAEMFLEAIKAKLAVLEHL